MYTRVTTVHFQPEKQAEVVRIFEDSVIPEARRQQGFVSALLLTNEATSDGISLVSFETAEQLQASEDSGYYQRQVEKFAPLLTGTPEKQVCEASIYELSGGAVRAARFVPTQLQPGALDEARRIFQDSILPDAHQQKGFQGELLLTDQAANRYISITLWETEQDRQASEAGGFYHKQLAKLSHLFAAEPVRELCVVSAQANMGARAVVGIDNKTIVRRFFEECWNQGNLAMFDQVVAANSVYHDVSHPRAEGLEEQKQIISDFRAAFPDTRMSIENLVAEGDMVACHWITQGTHQGTLQGIPPTGKRVTVPGISLCRVAAGKIVERWGSWDRLDMLQQLGVAPPLDIAASMQQPGAEPPPIH